MTRYEILLGVEPPPVHYPSAPLDPGPIKKVLDRVYAPLPLFGRQLSPEIMARKFVPVERLPNGALPVYEGIGYGDPPRQVIEKQMFVPPHLAKQKS